MKVSAYKRQQRHLRAKRKYWASVYTQNGLRRIAMPFVEGYTEEGEIVPLPPIKWNMHMPLFHMLRRQSSPVPVLDWKSITEQIAASEAK